MVITLRQRYSALVDAKLRDALVQRNGIIWNNKYDGSAKAGAVMVPVRDTEATVSAYNKASGVTASAAVGSFLTVTINKDYAVNEIIDGYDAASVPDDILADRLDSAGYALALQMNSDGSAELLSGGTTLKASGGTDDKTAITNANIYDYFVKARTALSKAKIPVTQRWALVSPDTMAALIKSPEFISASNLGDEVKQSGAVGQIAGFTVFEDTTLTAKVDFICGHPAWCTRVEEWQVMPKVVDLDSSDSFVGASAVKGRKVYAHKVTKAAAVIVKINA